MSRPISNSSKYFPLDVNYYNDVKIRQLLRLHGSKGSLLYQLILCGIYSDESGYSLHITDLHIIQLAEEIGCSEAEICEMLETMLDICLFDREIYDKYSTLTSRGVQRRFQEMLKNRGRKNSVPFTVSEAHWLLPLCDTLYYISLRGENGDTPGEKNNGRKNRPKEIKPKENKRKKSKKDEAKEDESCSGDVGATPSAAASALSQSPAAFPAEHSGSTASASAADLTRIGSNSNQKPSPDDKDNSIHEILGLYKELIGPCTSGITKKLGEYLNSGVEAALIMRLIEYSAEQQKLSWQYVEAAIEGNVREGILSLGAYNQNQTERRKSREKTRTAQPVSQTSPRYSFNNYVDTNAEKHRQRQSEAQRLQDIRDGRCISYRHADGSIRTYTYDEIDITKNDLRSDPDRAWAYQLSCMSEEERCIYDGLYDEDSAEPHEVSDGSGGLGGSGGAGGSDGAGGLGGSDGSGGAGGSGGSGAINKEGDYARNE